MPIQASSYQIRLMSQTDSTSGNTSFGLEIIRYDANLHNKTILMIEHSSE